MPNDLLSLTVRRGLMNFQPGVDCIVHRERSWTFTPFLFFLGMHDFEVGCTALALL